MSIENYIIDQEVIPVKITKSKARRRTITMKVDGEGIHFLAPNNVTQKSLTQFLDKKTKRILENWISSKQKKLFTQQFYNGEAIPFFGDKYPLNIHEHDKKTAKVIFDDGAFHCMMYANIAEDEKQLLVNKAMNAWYKKQATNFLISETKKIALDFNLRVDEIKVKNYKSKYGQCQGFDISYNYKIIQLPINIIRHIIAHELAHIKHKHHQKSFWDFVEQIDPDTKKHKKRLNKHGVLLE